MGLVVVIEQVVLEVIVESVAGSVFELVAFILIQRVADVLYGVVVVVLAVRAIMVVFVIAVNDVHVRICSNRVCAVCCTSSSSGL